MNEIKLNLARKWRSKNFDEVIGQDLCVRILKNSLYKGQLFPVYLLSGQRGCGKTTTARILAAAVNCQALSAFQRNPQQSSIPCLACGSCTAMIAGNHPDFIEIDAASHTGVDNVRTIIEASSYMPLLGTKKIYLIDEAHMLSKAAFNALLKILEEPPISALFMLATTDPHKVVDTVRSRCFQLFFKPVDRTVLLSHLAKVCEAEQVAYDAAGLTLVAAQSEGSVRDALNLIEQVRFTTKGITAATVLSVLGRVDDGVLISIVDAALLQGPARLLSLIKEHHISSYAPEYVWQRIIDLARSLLWAKHGVDAELFVGYDDAVQRCVSPLSIVHINRLLQALYEHEIVFTKTTAKHALIEMVLLYVAGFNSTDDSEGGASSVPQQAAPADASDQTDEEDTETPEEDDDEQEEDEGEIDQEGYATTWLQCMKQLEKGIDPLVYSLLRQATCTAYDAPTQTLRIELAKNLELFKDVLLDTTTAWYRVLQQFFGPAIQLQVSFCAPIVQPAEQQIKKIQPVAEAAVLRPSAPPAATSTTRAAFVHQPMVRPVNAGQRMYKKPVPKITGPVIDISDAATWQKANMLVRYFPGTVYEMVE